MVKALNKTLSELPAARRQRILAEAERSVVFVNPKVALM